MNDRGYNVAAARRICRGIVIRLLVALAAAVSASGAAAQRAVPAEFQGRWVPARATCESPVAAMVAADRLTLVNGKDSEALGGVEMAGPGFFPPDYRGIMAVLITESSGNQPATVIFNLGEKKGVAQVEYSPVQPGASTPQGKAYNARISKLNLARRFPLHNVPLKKCPSGR